MTHTVRHTGYDLVLNLSLYDLGHPDRPGLWDEIYHQRPFKPGLLLCAAVLEDGTQCPEAMYVQIRDSRRVAVHYRKGAADHLAPSESALHQALKDRVASSAETAGLSVATEDPSSDRARITDVLVRGSAGKKIGWEIQLSGISPRKVFERSGVAHRDGITPMWTVTKTTAAPINRAPWARLQVMDDWRMLFNRHLAVQGGVRKLVMRTC
jgi:hypothetical protein